MTCSRGHGGDVGAEGRTETRGWRGASDAARRDRVRALSVR